jgi:hypothetical protein
MTQPTSCCLSGVQLIQLVHCRARRRFNRGLKRKPMALIKRLRKAKKECQPMVRCSWRQHVWLNQLSHLTRRARFCLL